MVIDIKQTEAGDVDISGGDLIYNESTRQHERDLILAQKGHFKNVPAFGVGAVNFLNDEDPENFLRAVRKELTRDGLEVSKLSITGGELLIVAQYPET